MMAILQVRAGQRQAFGQYVYNAATDAAARAVLLSDPTFAIQPFCEPFPQGHRIVVVPETSDTTVMKLPLAVDVAPVPGMLLAGQGGVYEILGEYILKNCR